jgi:hypothetical protein
MKKLRVVSICILLALTGVHVASADNSNQADSFQSSGWVDLKNSNQKWIGISQHFRSESKPDYLDYDFNVECTWKKQFVVSLVAFPKGVKPTLNSDGIGYAQIKIDDGKFTKFAYVNMDEMTVKFAQTSAGSSDALMAAILKGKQQIVIKASTATSSNFTFTIKLGNLKSYAGKFKSTGCSLS